MSNKIITSIAAATISFFVASSCVAGSPDRFEAHMNLLASDLLAGRDTGSIGHDFTSLYIASELQKYGVKPGGDDGSYYQMIPFKQSSIDIASPKLMVTNGTDTLEFTFMDDMLMSPDMNYSESQLDGELVFAGFGIDAPYLNYSDYDGIDIKGKIAVVLVGMPGDFPSEEGAHYWRESTSALTAKGAIGVIAVHTPVIERLFRFERRKFSARSPSTRWLHPDGTANNASAQIRASSILSVEAGKKLFDLAGMDFDAIVDDIENNRKPKAQAMGLTATASLKSTHSQTQSPNVIGILEGSDPDLKNEYVILTAHSDHIGISKDSVLKDTINNGAMDNASGVSTLLEIAYELHKSGAKLKRSLIFAFVTGEEKGLLGSDYYGHYPTVPLAQIVANVNLDMPILTYRTNQMVVYGTEHSSLKSSVTDALARHNMELIPDPTPQQAFFVRSDQYSLVKQGIPAVYMDPGPDVTEETESMITADVFLKTHYHMPSDDLNLPIDYVWAAKFVDVNLEIAKNIANLQDRPSWNEDSFFKSFEKN
ncbi:M28 family metallopeptidase [Glaciecola petra]|uniref:M28 family metallopeptidase n=1 Tax=Glaciecola petra TaxID=3075602 RepID=A0ABU2ZW63_9ALTE|nr:M28 family metallopeptidase [Aestuariibacter sp. P117]MDT0596258.1 M28 family metallopeptidase [Aestuariibacter sp. P117]